MRQLQRSAVALVAGLAALACGGAAQARQDAIEPQQGTQQQGTQQGAQQAPQGGQEEGKTDTAAKPYASKKGLGAGVSGKGSFVLGPLETKGMGAGLGGEAGEQGAGEEGRVSPAPVPQYWLADASLFAANAGNAAQAIANESNLMVQAPGVLSNQAEFMISATDRAISSLQAVEASAAAVSPQAVSHIRDAVNELNAARAQATQTLDAANTGTLGTGHESTVKSTYDHLQAAQRAMQGAGRAYGITVALTPLRPFSSGRGFGAGIGGTRAPCVQKSPEGGGTKTAPEGGAKTPEKAPEAPPAPAPPPNPNPNP